MSCTVDGMTYMEGFQLKLLKVSRKLSMGWHTWLAFMQGWLRLETEFAFIDGEHGWLSNNAAGMGTHGWPFIYSVELCRKLQWNGIHGWRSIEAVEVSWVPSGWPYMDDFDHMLLGFAVCCQGMEYMDGFQIKLSRSVTCCRDGYDSMLSRFATCCRCNGVHGWLLSKAVEICAVDGVAGMDGCQQKLLRLVTWCPWDGMHGWLSS